MMEAQADVGQDVTGRVVYSKRDKILGTDNGIVEGHTKLRDLNRFLSDLRLIQPYQMIAQDSIPDLWDFRQGDWI